MQVTTGQNPTRVHLLFRAACLVGALIALASAVLIFSYRHLEIRDLLRADWRFHQRAASLLASELAQDPRLDFAPALARSIAGERDAQAWLGCPGQAEAVASAGLGASRRPRPSAGALAFQSDSGPERASSWPIAVGPGGICRLEIATDLTQHFKRVSERSYQIALSCAVFEGALLLALLWAARRGDQRLARAEIEQASMESELFFMAHYDSLTHLPNRSLFWERLDGALGRSRRLGKGIALVLVDLRGFGELNETLGRGAGDRVLIEAARRVQACARASDLVCRVGPDEFAILLEDVSPEDAPQASRALALDIARRFGQPWDDGRLPQTRCHCGIALHPRDGIKSEDLFSCAQQAARVAAAQDEPFLFGERRLA